MPRVMRRRRFVTQGQREPHLWRRDFLTVPTVTSVGTVQAGVLLDMNTFDTGIDARRTIKRFLVNMIVQVLTTAAGQLLRVFIGVVRSKLGVANAGLEFSTDAARNADTLAANCWAANTTLAATQQSLAALCGDPIRFDIRAMRKLDVDDELRLVVSADRGAGAVLAVGDSVIVTSVSSALVQRTRR